MRRLWVKLFGSPTLWCLRALHELPRRSATVEHVTLWIVLHEPQPLFGYPSGRVIDDELRSLRRRGLIDQHNQLTESGEVMLHRQATRQLSAA
jgi:hypothetical protein